MKKVLVSGAGGFVGARIMTQLADRYELCSFPKGMLAAANETAVQEHICRTQPDVILHTAAISDTGYSEKHPEESYRANVLLPLWMAQAAKHAGAKLICFSPIRCTRALTKPVRLQRNSRSALQMSTDATSGRLSNGCCLPCLMP